ncbi:MAG: DUF4350 domain-containing protein [Verrucomicrobiae bacterium]|nr:DUF4350 domain-containing protein [Verrucomicrobiae bacterium]
MPRHFSAILLVLLLAALAAGVFHILTLCFESGESHPPCSSLRADPLGAKAFHDSLARLPGILVERNYRSYAKIANPEQAAIFFFGETAEGLRNIPSGIVHELESLAASGGRLVITLLPSQPCSKDTSCQQPDAGKKSEKKAATPENNPSSPSGCPPCKSRKKKGTRGLNLDERWGFRMENTCEAPEKKSTAIWTVRNSSHHVPWHSGAWFEPVKPVWKVIARCGGHPVVIERRLGGGGIVLSADSFFISNEALLLERQPQLLAWLPGAKSRIIFDEFHLGVSESPGLAFLIRKYRLQGFIFGLIILAGLFIWRTACRFVPPPDDSGEIQPLATAQGQDAAAGLINLLRRNILPAQILQVCHREWRRALGHHPPLAENILLQLDQVVEKETHAPPPAKHPVAAYNAIREQIHAHSSRAPLWNRNNTPHTSHRRRKR